MVLSCINYLLCLILGNASGSDLVLEAIVEAEVANNAKEFFAQPQSQLKPE